MVFKIKILLGAFLYIGVIKIGLCQQATVTDTRDARIYKTIQIGSQVWMAENLAYTPVTTYTFDHNDLNYFYREDSSYYFCYNDSINNLKQYGALYTWDAAMKACPCGWHLPNALEYETLFKAVGNNKKSIYKSLVTGGSSGFNVKLGGALYYYTNVFPKFSYKNRYAFFWTSTRNKVRIERVGFWRAGKKANMRIVGYGGHYAFSVRCIKD